jgi:hypothetical protein
MSSVTRVIVVAWFCSRKAINDPVVLPDRGTLYEIAQSGHPRNRLRGTLAELEAAVGTVTIDVAWESDYCCGVHRRRGDATDQHASA